MELIIIEQKIDIACISEANLSQKYLESNNLIQGYICETKPMSDTVYMSRNIILINERMSYIRRKDLEYPLISTIWLQINLT